MKKLVTYVMMLTLAGIGGSIASAATPTGFANTTLVVSAQVNAACQETQHGLFPAPLMIDTQSPSDQTFVPTADERITCTNGMVFTIRVTSANGTALNQVCTASGVSGMSLKSASFPADTVAYSFLCTGDTDGSGHFVGAGVSTPRSLGISVKVLAANAQAAIAHADYADTVTLTISY